MVRQAHHDKEFYTINLKKFDVDLKSKKGAPLQNRAPFPI